MGYLFLFLFIVSIVAVVNAAVNIYAQQKKNSSRKVKWQKFIDEEMEGGKALNSDKNRS